MVKSKLKLIKLFIVLILLIIGFQSLSNADDIKDFEIEGISIGDSLLDYYSEDEINKNIKHNYFTHIKDKTFIAMSINDVFFQNYDVMQFVFKKNDKTFKIFGITGGVYYRDNINDCYGRMEEISEDISKNINFIEEDKFQDRKMSANRGKYSGQTFFLNKGIISVHCYDWSDEIEKKNNWIDNLRINIKTDEFENFLQKD
jgi:hypothetical protein